LGQIFRLSPVPDETVNEIQNGSLVAVYQDFKGISVTVGNLGH
jgi:hypothetical protein